MIDEPRTAICEIIMAMLKSKGHKIKLDPSLGFDTVYIKNPSGEFDQEIHFHDDGWDGSGGQDSLSCVTRGVRRREVLIKFISPENPDFDPEVLLKKVLKALEL